MPRQSLGSHTPTSLMCLRGAHLVATTISGRELTISTVVTVRLVLGATIIVDAVFLDRLSSSLSYWLWMAYFDFS